MRIVQGGGLRLWLVGDSDINLARVRPQGIGASGGFDEFPVLQQDPAVTCVAFERRRADDVREFNSAPGTFTSRFAQAEDWPDEGRGNPHKDNGNSKECAETGTTEHPPNNETHGCDDEAKEKPAECGFDGRLFCFCRCRLLFQLDFITARGAKAPRRRNWRSAFLATVGH